MQEFAKREVKMVSQLKAEVATASQEYERNLSLFLHVRQPFHPFVADISKCFGS